MSLCYSQITLSGRTILVVEDDFFISEEIVLDFEKHGAIMLGPIATVEQACNLIGETKNIDGAVLDVNLHGQMSFPAADMLIARDIPFVFATGYDESVFPQAFSRIHKCQKPVEPTAVAKALFET